MESAITSTVTQTASSIQIKNEDAEAAPPPQYNSIITDTPIVSSGKIKYFRFSK